MGMKYSNRNFCRYFIYLLCICVCPYAFAQDCRKTLVVLDAIQDPESKALFLSEGTYSKRPPSVPLPFLENELVFTVYENIFPHQEYLVFKMATHPLPQIIVYRSQEYRIQEINNGVVQATAQPSGETVLGLYTVVTIKDRQGASIDLLEIHIQLPETTHAQN